MISDIVSAVEVPEYLRADPELWSGCISGAFQEEASIRSRRATDYLRELARYCTRHSEVDEVAALRQRITTTLLAS